MKKSPIPRPAPGHCRVDFFFSMSGFDPDEITARLRLRPTREARKGEMNRGLERPWSVWELTLEPLSPSESPALVLTRLVGMLVEHQDAIGEIVRGGQTQCGVRMTYWVDGGTLGLWCEPRDLRFVADVCGSFTIDHVIVAEPEATA